MFVLDSAKSEDAIDMAYLETVYTSCEASYHPGTQRYREAYTPSCAQPVQQANESPYWLYSIRAEGNIIFIP